MGMVNELEKYRENTQEEQYMMILRKEAVVWKEAISPWKSDFTGKRKYILSKQNVNRMLTYFKR